MAVLGGRPDRARLPPATLEEGQYEAIARLAYLFCGRWPQPPEAMCSELQIEVFIHERLFCRAISDKSWIAMRVNIDPGDSLQLFHELAHVLLAEKYPEANETDAWLLTVQLALPPWVVKSYTTRALRDLAQVPDWFFSAALEMYASREAA